MAISGRITLVGISARLVAALSLLAPGCQSPFQIYPVASSCAVDGDIPAADREAVDQVALQFVQNALGPDTASAYSSFTAEAKQSLTSGNFVAMFQQAVKPMGPFKNLNVSHTYIAKVTGGDQAQRAVCGNVSRPEGWVAVSVKPGPAQAHVIVEGRTVNNTAAFMVWLVPEQGNWRVQYVHFAIISIVDKSAEDLQAMAELEQQQQHHFNAYLLYAAAFQLADRGPYFQLGIRPEIEKGMEEVGAPRNLEGRPPFTWKFGESTFRILNVGPIGVAGKIYLIIDHEIEPWAENKDAERKNRDLIAAFAKTYPEYKHVFAGLVVRAHERGGTRSFGTVEEKKGQSK